MTMALTQQCMVHELMVERLRSAVDIPSVALVYDELVRSVERALSDEDDAETLERRFLVADTVFRRAWRRVGDDLLGLLEQEDDD
jgi:hypothetical protein